MDLVLLFGMMAESMWVNGNLENKTVLHNQIIKKEMENIYSRIKRLKRVSGRMARESNGYRKIIKKNSMSQTWSELNYL